MREAPLDWLDLIFRRSSEAVVIGTTTGVITNANAAAERLFGYGAGEMTGLVQADTIDDPERLAPAIARGKATGSFGGQLWLVRKDGTRFEGEVFTVRFDTDEGERIWMMIHNVSLLRESELQFRALSEATFEAVIVHDAGTILFANASAHKIFRVEDLRGSNMFDYVAPESIELVRQASSTRDERPYEAVGKRADGTTFAAEARGRTIQHRGRTVRIVTIRDISERKRLEADLAAREQLATIGRLAAGVAHEVNNPLTFAMLNLQSVTRALAAGDVGEERRPRLLEMLDHIQTGLDRVSRVVKDMRRFSRVEPPRATAVEIGRVLEYAASVVGPEIRARATLDVDVANAPLVRGDEARLGQVFVNLLTNAAQSIPEGNAKENRVEVRVEDLGDWVEITVRDTGCGIPASMREHLFEPFSSTKAAGVGVGLGLSICHAIVTSLGGVISAEEAVGGGACFRVRLPRAGDSDTASPVLAAAPSPPVPRRWRLLLVNDEPLLRSVVAKALSDEFEISVAESVEAALALLGSGERFEAILCDIVMPERTGMDFYEEVERRFPAMAHRIGFITGGVLDPTIQEFLESSGRPRVYKPFTLDELVETVQTLAGAE